MLYRVKQFVWALISIFKEVDNELLDKYLREDEKLLFNKLKKSEKHHCIRVCNDCLLISKGMNLDTNKLARISLLHDIGKTEGSLNIIEKSILVIMNKLTGGYLINKCSKYKKIDLYYNHPKKGVDILKRIGIYDEEFLEAIENHHLEDVYDNKYLSILKECDDKN